MAAGGPVRANRSRSRLDCGGARDNVVRETARLAPLARQLPRSSRLIGLTVEELWTKYIKLDRSRGRFPRLEKRARRPSCQTGQGRRERVILQESSRPRPVI